MHRWSADIAGMMQRCGVRSDILVGDLVLPMGPYDYRVIFVTRHLELTALCSATASMKCAGVQQSQGGLVGLP